MRDYSIIWGDRKWVEDGNRVGRVEEFQFKSLQGGPQRRSMSGICVEMPRVLHTWGARHSGEQSWGMGKLHIPRRVPGSWHQLALVTGSSLWRNFQTQKLWRWWTGLRKRTCPHVGPLPTLITEYQWQGFQTPLLYLPIPARLENGLFFSWRNWTILGDKSSSYLGLP